MMRTVLVVLLILSMLAIGLSIADGDEAKTIVETVAIDDNLSTLAGAIDDSGLAETLNDSGPFTLFAPTDNAFAAMKGFDQIDDQTLTEIIKYHIISGALMTKDVIANTSISTLQGENLTINATDKDVMVNNAKVTRKDIICSNGVIHVIDAVLRPSSIQRLQEELLEEERLEKEQQEEERKWEKIEKEVLKNVPPSQMPDTPLSEMPTEA
jgi:uncharacterized surface protein with fasciclin (FAS1) repeats